MLNAEPVTLTPPAPIALIPGRQLPVRYAEIRRQYTYLPDLASLSRELDELTMRGGVPLSVDDGKPWIRFYAHRCCLTVRVTSRGDAFAVEFIEPLTLRHHERLTRSRLRIAPPRWLYCAALGTVPPGCNAPDRQIREYWKQSRHQPDRPVGTSVPASHVAFCDALDLVVEGARQIELAKNDAQPALPYYDVLSTAEARRSAAGIYVFLLSRPGKIDAGAMVELRQAPDLRGVVSAVDGERLTVRFDSTVDRRRIAAQGDLVVSGGDFIQRVQRDAVAKLRAGTALNPRLLPLLADTAFAAYSGPAQQVRAVTPAQSLDPDQTEAFHRALSVPDLLCVVGPPGTGKTRTIVEIAGAAAARGERVLVASQTNTAVDNVVERLPALLTAVRVGNEGRISGAVQHRTLAATATELHRRILEGTHPTAYRLQPWFAEPSPARGWLNRLDTALAAVSSAQQGHEEASTTWRAAVAAVEHRFAEPLRQSRLAFDAAQRQSMVAAEEVRRWAGRLSRAQSRTAGSMGFLYRWWAGRCARRYAQAQEFAAQTQAHVTQAARTHERWNADLHRTIGGDPAVGRSAELAANAQAAIESSRAGAEQAMQRIARLVAGVVALPVVAQNIEGLRAFATWYRGWDPLLRARAQLLQDWREQLEQPPDQLHAELIRYADVIGTTCIGVGVQKNMLTDLEFDLVIIDEAGQIPLPSTLVPLVQARRAVLVGDHHQLPPFVDDDVRLWLQQRDLTSSGVAPAQVAELLTRSAFERLVGVAPPTNQVLLSRQRRMPAVLADFASVQFYGGRLATDTEPRPPSPLFRSPLALIDTSDLSARDRAERRRPRSETWQAAGCDNLTEARLVVDLVQWYARHEREWAVVTPYRAQAQLSTQRLREMLGDDAVRDRVGTVDAFQGREYDIVVYSFTRSNPTGQVGFLAELRRLNVAITRAREQLILIGDVSTLTRAHDPGFRQLAVDLYAYARQHGDIVASRQLRDRLS